jgi:hypothetical protein
LRLLLIVLLFWSFPGCGQEFSCHTGEMRCLGDTAQMCNANHDWVDWLNCGMEGMTCYIDRSHCGGSGDVACCD